MTIISILPFLLLVPSLAAALAVACLKDLRLHTHIAFIAGLATFLLALSAVPAILSGNVLRGFWIMLLPNVSFSLRVDGASIIFCLMASFLWMLTAVFAKGYMQTLREHSQRRFNCFFALSMFATFGAALADNLIVLYMFYEILSLATWPLVTHEQNAKARSAGRKYLLYIMGPSIALVLPAIIVVYIYTGSADFSAIGDAARMMRPSSVIIMALAFVFGFSKAAVMPLHAWLPAAMVAPTPVSALLHAVAVVKVGAYCIYRTLTGFDAGLFIELRLDDVVCALAAITIIAASLIALSQDNLKRRLAFSTIGQLGYIVLGVGMMTPIAVTGALLHIVTHAFGKITLFFCAGTIYVTSGKTEISDMSGLGRAMPWTFAFFAIGALSVIGLPPFTGFISKWYLALGAWEGGHMLLLMVILVSSLLNAAYFMPIIFRAFYVNNNIPRLYSPNACRWPLTITGCCTVIFFFFSNVIVDLANSMLPFLGLGGM